LTETGLQVQDCEYYGIACHFNKTLFVSVICYITMEVTLLLSWTYIIYPTILKSENPVFTNI